MEYIRYILTAIVSTTAYLVGGWDKAMKVLLVLIIIDYVTGIMKSAFQGEIDSKVGFKGIIKKVCIFIVVAVAVQIESFLGQPESLHNVVIYFYVVNESISVLENVGDFIPIPDELKKFIKQLRGKDKNKDGGKK